MRRSGYSASCPSGSRHVMPRRAVLPSLFRGVSQPLLRTQRSEYIYKHFPQYSLHITESTRRISPIYIILTLCSVLRIVKCFVQLLVVKGRSGFLSSFGSDQIIVRAPLSGHWYAHREFTVSISIRTYLPLRTPCHVLFIGSDFGYVMSLPDCWVPPSYLQSTQRCDKCIQLGMFDKSSMYVHECVGE